MDDKTQLTEAEKQNLAFWLWIAASQLRDSTANEQIHDLVWKLGIVNQWNSVVRARNCLWRLTDLFP